MAYLYIALLLKLRWKWLGNLGQAEFHREFRRSVVVWISLLLSARITADHPVWYQEIQLGQVVWLVNLDSWKSLSCGDFCWYENFQLYTLIRFAISLLFFFQSCLYSLRSGGQVLPLLKASECVNKTRLHENEGEKVKEGGKMSMITSNNVLWIWWDCY